MRIASFSLALAGAVAAGALGSTPRAPAGEAPPPPNVIVITSDDQDAAGIAAMPETRERIGAEGTKFNRSVVNFPLCCPSRATFLTGQYSHNNGVEGNLPPDGGVRALDESSTLPVWLQEAGYHTALMGKYLNGYEFEPPEAPPGWSEWHAMRNHSYYGYTLLEGFPPAPLAPVQYGSLDEDPDAPANPGSYLTDVLTGKAVDLIEQRTPLAPPFFLWLTYLAPHGGGPTAPDARCTGDLPKPAVRHLGYFDGTPLPTPPSFNERNVSDKPRLVRRQPRLTEAQRAALQIAWRCHRESLLAVDEGIAQVVDAVETAGEAGNTIVVFTSDNGLIFGQHRGYRQKNRPYEEAIRVPLLIRGPGFEAGTEVKELTVNADLAATILDAADVEAGLRQDGRSLIPLARNPGRRLGREIVLQGPFWSGVRNARFTYVEHKRATWDGVELYDLRRDPYQLRSLHRSRRYRDELRALKLRLARLEDCRGRACRRRPRVRLRVARPRCAGRRALVVAAGRQAGALVTVRFRTAAGGTTDSRAPFEVSVRRGRTDEVTARAKLIDGRIVTLAPPRVPRC
jgi:arylsulfatase A-like enzyme